MSQDEIIEMAKQAGLLDEVNGWDVWFPDELEAFAKLVEDKVRQELREEIIYTWVPPHFVDLAIKEEREACALRAEDFLIDPEPNWDGDFWNQAVERVAMAIRARGEA
jgi:hypothetical protein